MTKLKYKILTRVHASTHAKPVYRSDFYKKSKKINLYKKNLDELIGAKLLEQSVSSDRLAITPKGIDAMEEEAIRISQMRHDWRIALLGIIGGGIMGVLTSLVTLYIQGLL